MLAETATALMLWAAAYTGLPVTDMPDITEAGGCLIEEAATGRACVKDGKGPNAAYRDGVVYLPRGWDPENPHHMSLLLHELVHHMQWMSGQQILCRAERQAYAAQMTWLRTQGHDPYEIMKLTPWELWPLMHVSCRN